MVTRSSVTVAGKMAMTESIARCGQRLCCSATTHPSDNTLSKCGEPSLELITSRYDHSLCLKLLKSTIRQLKARTAHQATFDVLTSIYAHTDLSCRDGET